MSKPETGDKWKDDCNEYNGHRHSQWNFKEDRA